MKTREEDHNRPIFTIGIVADMLGVTQATLRIWEKKGLIKPQRLGKNRFYSYRDLDRLKEIKHLLQEKKLNIAGVKNILVLTRCWDIKKCGVKRYSCPVYQTRQKDIK
ncbi:MAG TPA: MerR family transcriptional regulator [Proteobacteria bacterium]|nr:MerR family transcriptional regulator [Pseudomonadota bacterium]